MQVAETDFSQPMSEHDKTLLVKFYLKPKLDPAATEREGREIYKDVEYIDIKIPGNRSGGAVRPATKADKDRFPQHYAAFKNRIEAEDVVEGTLLSEWPPISRSRVEELAFFNVRTVEQLANMADTQSGKFMGLNELRDKAKAWLDQAKKENDVAVLQGMVEEMKIIRQQQQDQMAAMESEKLDLQRQLSEMAKEILDLKRPAKPRGRAKKSE